MGFPSVRVTPIRALTGFISSTILSAYFYDKYEASKLHKRAVQLAKEIGEHPLDPEHTLTQSKRLILFWTCKNFFSNQLVRNNFRKYAGNYLTLAGIDYDLHEIVLSKARFSSRVPGTSDPTFDEFVRQLYSSKERYLEKMNEIIEPKEYVDQWDEVKLSNKLVYSLNEADSVVKGTLIAGIIPCNESESLLRRMAKSFFERKKLELIIERTFNLIQQHNQLDRKSTTE